MRDDAHVACGNFACCNFAYRNFAYRNFACGNFACGNFAVRDSACIGRRLRVPGCLVQAGGSEGHVHQWKVVCVR